MIRTAAFILAITLAFGFVGKWDYEEAKAQEERYAQMVCDGLWPDYENRNPECE